jgi:predicted methyltransferase
VRAKSHFLPKEYAAMRLPASRILPFALALALGTVAVSASASPVPAYVKAAVADPARAGDLATDARRHGGELLAFSEAKPGSSVLELIPGGGYFTRLFSKTVGAKGHVYLAWPNQYAGEARTDVENSQALAKSKDFGNVEVLVQPAEALAVPHPVDVVFTSQNYHDYNDKFMAPATVDTLNRQVFAALKPGGTWIIVDHVAEPGSGMRDTDTLHRIDPAIVRKQVEAAGFTYVGESKVLRNPADGLKIKVFDKAIRGHTDQFAYKFRKPK